jgi:nucleoid DNA-binding protein
VEKAKYYTIQQIADELADIGVTRKMLDSVCKVIGHALVNGERVKLPNVATIFAKEFAGRRSRNPQTGEAIEVGPSRRLRIKAAKSLKDALNV